MPVELILSPLMRPVVRAKSILFSPHRNQSHYIPQIREMPTNVSQYAVVRRFGSGSKIFDVFDTQCGAMPVGPNNPKERIFWFQRSRAVKGAYRMYSSAILGTGPQGQDEPVANVRAGLRGNVLLIRAPDAPAAELGWHVVSHRVDAIDSYRMFTMNNGQTYQWTFRGQWLELVHNVGEKESEIRERIGRVVINGTSGFTLYLDESKMIREIALGTALCSFIDQWNTNLEVGGIYGGRSVERVRWKRD
ncbi:uncharacterized protein LODBEIA_P46050 [Lodderomyces beijingensis]|uniref:Uncharacterized protein n=1 Tax=Lodderomyces beijingensis TaxID=1775926 RepID=A0ABP0ZTU1_9ASCO